MSNKTTSAPRSNYKTPVGMKRLWTITGSTGVGRLLADESRQTHLDIELHTSSKGTRFQKPMRIQCPRARRAQRCINFYLADRRSMRTQRG